MFKSKLTLSKYVMALTLSVGAMSLCLEANALSIRGGGFQTTPANPTPGSGQGSASFAISAKTINGQSTLAVGKFTRSVTSDLSATVHASVQCLNLLDSGLVVVSGVIEKATGPDVSAAGIAEGLSYLAYFKASDKPGVPAISSALVPEDNDTGHFDPALGCNDPFVSEGIPLPGLPHDIIVNYILAPIGAYPYEVLGSLKVTP